MSDPASSAPAGAAPRVVMYATDWCPYCNRARRLLARKNLPFEEIDIEMSPEARAQMQSRSGRTSVPQIFIGDTHVGGSDDLHALEADGRLDAMLGRGAARAGPHAAP
jgi:glutaredoxin 3